MDKYYAYRDFKVLDKDNNIIIKATSKWINRIVYAISSFVIVVFVLLTIGRFATGMYENDSHVEKCKMELADKNIQPNLCKFVIFKAFKEIGSS